MPQDSSSSRRRDRRSRSTSSSRRDDKTYIKRYDRTDRYTKRDYNDDYRGDGRRNYRRSRSRDYSSRRTNRHRSSRSKSHHRSRTPRSRSRSHNKSRRSDRTSNMRDREELKSRHENKKKSQRLSKSPSAERDMTPIPPEPPQISERDHDLKPQSSCDNSRSDDEFSNINDINLPTENYTATNSSNNRNSKSNYKSKSETYKYYGEDSNIEELDKEKIQQEMQERLRQHLAAEGKIYPPPKPQQASHPFFANDGSFLETFKRMQEQQQMFCQSYIYQPVCNVPTNVTTNISASELNKFENTPSSNIITQQQQQSQYQPPISQPIFGKRRGGKILKTGIVEKPRPIQELDSDNVKDAWSMYMQEVKKYKNSACDISSKTRPLLK